MAKAFYNNFVKYGTRIHTFEFNPLELNIALTEGVLNTKERLTDIKHNWFERNGFERICGINAQFFGTYTMGLQFVDSGFMTNKNTIDDQFLELILENGKLHIDNLIHPDLLTKYPDANWAAGMGFALVIDGKVNLLYGNKFSHTYGKNPRSAIGQKANGSIVLLTTDGRNTGSLGLTGPELAETMLGLGCITAISADGGGSSQMNCNIDGNYLIMNKLEGNYQRPITSAFVVYGKDAEVVDLTKKEQVEKTDEIRDFSVLYSHFDKVYVKERDQVTPHLKWKDGTKIGKMGNTGKSTGAHVHIGAVHGKQTELWRLSDMANGNPSPSKEQTDYFIDEYFFETSILISEGGGWLGYKDHYAYDVVPLNRRLTMENYDVVWNRSFAGRVTKVGYDPAYGNYVIIWYNIL